MNCTGFIRGMGVGLAVGTTIGSIMPKKHCRHKHTAAKAIRTISHMMDELSEAL